MVGHWSPESDAEARVTPRTMAGILGARGFRFSVSPFMDIGYVHGARARDIGFANGKFLPPEAATTFGLTFNLPDTLEIPFPVLGVVRRMCLAIA
jgi:hypothetical protein